MSKAWIFILVFALIFSIGSGFAAAQTTTVVSEIGRPGVLPTSPFYFLKEWSRGIQSFFVFNPIAKAELELKFADERAVEAKILAEEKSGEGIERAIENYKENMERLQSRLESLSETSANPNVDRLLDELAERAVSHQTIFGEIKEDNLAIEEKVEAVQEAIDASLAVALEKLDLLEKIGSRFEKSDELKVLNVISRLEDAVESREIKNELFQVGEKVVLRLEGKIEAGEITLPDLPVLIKDLPESAEVKIEILDTIRGGVSEDSIKTQLNVIRQDLLKEVEQGGAAKEDEAAEAIESANRILTEIQAAGQAATAASRQLIDQAKFNLEQAKRAFEAGDYGRAFGLATSASAIAKNAWRQLNQSSASIREEVEDLKKDFDELKAEAAEKGLTSENSPRLFRFFSEAETKIAVAITSPSAAVLKEVRILFGSIEALIEAGKTEAELEIEDEFEELDDLEKELGRSLPAEWQVEIKEGRFNPPTLKIKKGDRVIWINADGSAAWPATAVHPTHAVYPGSSIEKCNTAEASTIFDACKSLAKGESWGFVFNQVGTWKYHNHVLSGSTGVIEVEE